VRRRESATAITAALPSGASIIDGEVKGTVRSKDRLILGENARIEGEIECAFLSVAGRLTGNIRCSSRLEILQSGMIQGDVHTPCLVMEEGAILEGRCHMCTEDKVVFVDHDMTASVSETVLGSSDSDSREVN
jgi:cytoskeletal protein CcmA (bactofilin family)